MESFCIYILDINYELNQIMEMVDIASKQAFPGETLDKWIGFNGFYIKEVVDHFNFKVSKLSPKEAYNAFDKIIFIGFDEDILKNLKTKNHLYDEYTFKQIAEKTDNVMPIIMPYEVIKSRGDADQLLVMYTKYRDNEEILSFVKSFLKEI